VVTVVVGLSPRAATRARRYGQRETLQELAGMGDNRTERPKAVLTRDAYSAFASGDLESLKGMMTDSVWHEPGTSPTAGRCKDRDQITEFFVKQFDIGNGTFRTQVVDILVNDDRAMVIQHTTATRDGKKLDTREVLEFKNRDGKFVRTQLYPSDVHQEDDVWS
jgi:ketosteroid isomerase-like protein